MEVLKPYRARIDALDDKIVDLLVQRFDIIREVGPLKYREGIAPILQDRVDEVRERNADHGARRGIDRDFMRRLYALIIDESCALEQRIADKLSASGSVTKVRK